MATRRPVEPAGLRLTAALAAVVPRDLPAPSRDPGQIQRAVHEVLSRAEYRPPARPLLQRILSFLFERLGALLAGLGNTPAGTIIGILVFVAILALLAVLATRFIRTMSRSPELDAAVAVGPHRSGAEWRAEAEAHEAAGEWRQAVRCRYRALIADLARLGIVDEVPGRTSGEYRGEVGRNLPSALEPFAGATDVFERAWYGRRPTGAGEAASFRQLAGRVLERSPR